MKIGVITQCMTGVQFESGDEHIQTMKYYADLCFLPYSSGYWIFYLVGRIKNG